MGGSSGGSALDGEGIWDGATVKQGQREAAVALRSRFGSALEAFRSISDHV